MTVGILILTGKEEQTEEGKWRRDDCFPKMVSPEQNFFMHPLSVPLMDAETWMGCMA